MTIMHQYSNVNQRQRKLQSLRVFNFPAPGNITSLLLVLSLKLLCVYAKSILITKQT